MGVAEVIPAALGGERVDRVVALVCGCSRAEAAALVASGDVRVGGAVVPKPSVRLVEGDVLEVAWDGPDAAPLPVADPAVVVPVLYADASVIVVDKPAGMVVHPGNGNESGTLVHGLLVQYPDLATVGEPHRPGIVHRLDRDTSGLLVVARTDEAYDSLVAQLAARTVERRYDALVWGHPDAATGVVDAPIGRSPRHPTRMAVSATGRDARTHYEVVATWHDPVVAQLACRLETGRTHQIRVHFAAIGHPVVGDRTYGGVRQSFPVSRQWLHAATLAFDHPATGERVSFSAPRPADLPLPG